jgi:hypothetical protein
MMPALRGLQFPTSSPTKQGPLADEIARSSWQSLHGFTMVTAIDTIASIITVASFVWAIWVWRRSEDKIHAFTRVLRSIHDIASAAVWEADSAVGVGDEYRLRTGDKLLSTTNAILKLTAPHLPRPESPLHGQDLGHLIERGTVWTSARVLELERSEAVVEVWIVSHDLQPDSSDPIIGDLVAENIKRGTRYVFFFPDNFAHKDMELQRLRKNIGILDKPQTQAKVEFVPVPTPHHERLFSHKKNTGLYFFDRARATMPKCLEEIHFYQVRDRGSYWQEHDEVNTRELRSILLDALNPKTAQSEQQNPTSATPGVHR